MPELLAFLAAAILVCLGGWFAACDAALQVVSTADLEREADRAKRGGTQLRRIAGNPPLHSMSVAFGRVLSEMLATILVTFAIQSLVGQWWLTLLLTAITMTLVSFLLLGASPRAVGRANPVPLLRVSAPLIRFARTVFGPLASLLLALTDRITPGRTRVHAFANEAQLLSIVDEAANREVLEEEERELIHSVFAFGETRVREVMVPRPDMITIDAEASVETALLQFLEHGLSRMPVLGESSDDVVGILYLRDVVRARQWRPDEGETARDLARPAFWLPDSKRADAALTSLRNDQVHVAMVSDEYGSTAGLVTLEDLVEELVGEIEDEYDKGELEIEPISEAELEASSRADIDDVAEHFGVEIEEDDVDTLGGYVQKLLGRLPEVDDVVADDRLRFRVLRLDGRGRITGRIRVEALSPAEVAAQHAERTGSTQMGEG